jgi:hypothetical protein
MQRVAVPAKSTTGGVPQVAPSGAPGADISLGSWVVKVRSKSGLRADPTGPEATVVTSAPAKPAPVKSMQLPVLESPPAPPALHGLVFEPRQRRFGRRGGGGRGDGTGRRIRRRGIGRSWHHPWAPPLRSTSRSLCRRLSVGVEVLVLVAVGV